MRALILVLAASALAGCRVLAAVFEERTLRMLALLVVVSAIVGFALSRMRR